MTVRRQFDLPESDVQFLEDCGYEWETVLDGSRWVLIHSFPTHPGYNHQQVTVAIRIEAGYPMNQLDMAYFHPSLCRADGIPIGATQVLQPISGVSFQRWSRHRTSENPWRPGFDSLETHIHLIEDWLRREFEK